MKSLISILLLITISSFSQDSLLTKRRPPHSLDSLYQTSVKATILKVAEKTVVYKIEGMRFISFDCRCDTLKRGDVFWIPKKRFDSLLKEAKPIRKRKIEN